MFTKNYNKTHAKYQACITHYRKQHYLGRYKLAVDAALAMPSYIRDKVAKTTAEREAEKAAALAAAAP